MATAFLVDEQRGTRLASGSDDATVRLWDVSSGMSISRFEGISKFAAQMGADRVLKTRR